MAELTEKEYDELDEFFTKNTFMPSGKGGFLSRNKGVKLIVIDDTIVPNYSNARMLATKNSPAAMMRNIARKEMALA